jgi:hypothetical protein
MSFSPCTFQAPLAMEDLAVQQGAPQNLPRLGQFAGESLSVFEKFISFHQQ